MTRKILDKITAPSADEIHHIKTLIQENPSWHRTNLSKEVCKIWNWRDSKGNLKDMACRNFLLKLHQSGKINLPEKRRLAPKRKTSTSWIEHDTTSITGQLKDLLPLRLEIVSHQSKHHLLFQFLLQQYHYLSFKGTVGRNMRYLIFDRLNRPLSCFSFEAAAWRVKERDCYIGWNYAARLKNLGWIANNSRFLILPWVQVPHLASHLLGRMNRRLAGDWYSKYEDQLYLLETFIERPRFQGTCYKAANWRLIGQTTGRSRNDRYHTKSVAIKDVYLFPLRKRFRQLLCNY